MFDNMPSKYCQSPGPGPAQGQVHSQVMSLPSSRSRSQHCQNTVNTLSQHCHNTATVTTLSKHYNNTVTTLSQHCLNTVTRLSQYFQNKVTTKSQHCHRSQRRWQSGSQSRTLESQRAFTISSIVFSPWLKMELASETAPSCLSN